MTTYIVVGAHSVGGCAPGEQITVDDEDDAARLVAGGHIELKGKPSVSKADKEAVE